MREVIPSVVGWERPRGGTDQSGGTLSIPIITSNLLDIDGTYTEGNGVTRKRVGVSGDRTIFVCRRHPSEDLQYT